MRRVSLLAFLCAAGCSDALEQTSSAGQVIGFTNPNTVSLIAPVGFAVTTADLPGTYAGASVAGGESVFLIFRSASSGSRVDVLDLSQPVVTPEGFTLPGSAVGGAVQDDSIAWLAVVDPTTVVRINYRAQVATTIAVSGPPRAVAITAGHVFVINAGVGSGSSSWVSKVDPVGRSVVDSIPLTATGPTSAVVGGDGLLYVVGAGPPFGRVSVVDPVGGVELAVINGLSDDVGPAVFHASGRLLIAAVAEGILEVNTLNRSVTRGPGNGVKPGGRGISALALDNGGRIYAGDPACSVVHVLTGPPDYREVRPVSVAGCPVAAATAVRP